MPRMPEEADRPMTGNPTTGDSTTVDSTAGNWLNSITVLTSFGDVADDKSYVPLPDDWLVGLSEIGRAHV